ncbi:helix-turn-helix domain protein [archaeon]|nr:helix-turn-helix domain protein [archaeon]
MNKGGVMLKSYKHRLYPSKKQIVKLEATLDTCRHLYNNALGSRKLQAELYRLPIEKQWITVKTQSKALPLVYSQVLQNVLRRVSKSFDNFFRRIKNYELPGYPRIKSYTRYNSFTYPQSTNNAFRIINNKKLRHCLIIQ